MQGKLISTQPIHYAGEVVSNKGISEKPHISENEIVVGYIICKADNFTEVEQWSKTCPVLKYEQASVEIREIMPFTL